MLASKVLKKIRCISIERFTRYLTNIRRRQCVTPQIADKIWEYFKLKKRLMKRTLCLTGLSV